MKKLPTINKKLGSGLTKSECVRKVVLGVALAVGMGSAVIGEPVMASPAAGTKLLSSTNSQALLLQPNGTERGDIIAYHYSHASHSSHQSHYSHYSSRY